MERTIGKTSMITTLIPAYKTTYIDELLHCLATQTYKQFKVIVSDDSPDGIVNQVIQSKQLSHLIQQLNITVIRGPMQGGYTNTFNLVRNFANNGAYFHIMLDDDVIYPTFYETHIREHQKSNALVSVSARWNANKQGQPFALTMDNSTSQAFEQDFSAANIANQLVSKGTNKLGEYSHAVYKREAASIILNPSINGISYFGIDDIGSFIHASIQHAGIWIPCTLGFFRVHGEQNTQNTQNDTIKCSHYAWIALGIACYEQAWISETQLWALITKIKGKVQMRFSQDALGIKMLNLFNSHTNYSTNFKDEFLVLWNSYLKVIKVQDILDGDLRIKLL